MFDIMTRLRERLTEDGVAPDDSLLADCAEMAKNMILTRRFPYGGWPVDAFGESYVEPQYEDLQVRLAIDLYNKVGAEGEIIHDENGINRTYEGSWVSKQLLEEITPFCGAVK